MRYKLNIIKYVPNEKYEKEMAEYNEKKGYYSKGFQGDDHNYPSPEKIERSLDVTLTEEEFKKIKLEVFKVFE